MGTSLMLSTLSNSARRIAMIRRSLLGAFGLCAATSAPIAGIPTVGAQATVAQATPAAQPTRRMSRREDLETGAKNLELRARSEKDAGKRGNLLYQAGVIRARLASGDFQPGHRILLFVGGDSALVDTFTVRSDQKLQLPELPEISLAGVLDSELQGYLQTQLAQYIRNPTVRAQALLRVSVSGDVGSPGFYSVRTDTPVSDVIMTAGGPSASLGMHSRANSCIRERESMPRLVGSSLVTSADTRVPAGTPRRHARMATRRRISLRSRSSCPEARPASQC